MSQRTVIPLKNGPAGTRIILERTEGAAPVLSLHHAAQTDEATYITSRLSWEEVEVLYHVLDGMLLHHDIETGSLRPPGVGVLHG